MGTLMIRDGRMLVALCRGPADPKTGEGHGYSSYGGPFEFAGLFFETHVEMTSDPRQHPHLGERGYQFHTDVADAANAAGAEVCPDSRARGRSVRASS